MSGAKIAPVPLPYPTRKAEVKERVFFAPAVKAGQKFFIIFVLTEQDKEIVLVNPPESNLRNCGILASNPFEPSCSSLKPSRDIYHRSGTEDGDSHSHPSLSAAVRRSFGHPLFFLPLVVPHLLSVDRVHSEQIQLKTVCRKKPVSNDDVIGGPSRAHISSGYIVNLKKKEREIGYFKKCQDSSSIGSMAVNVTKCRHVIMSINISAGKKSGSISSYTNKRCLNQAKVLCTINR